MRVLVTGSDGLLGRHIVRALELGGHRAIRASRHAHEDDANAMRVDFADDVDANVWMSRLAGIDVVVNAAGIAREHGRNSFDAVHTRAPQALFSAASRMGLRRVIQISALGADGDTAHSRFLETKRLADDFLLGLPISGVVVLPSLVFSVTGDSTRLLASLAAAPLVLLPGDGRHRVQPVHVDDVAEGVLRLVDADLVPRRVALVGPARLRLRDYLAELREHMGYSDTHVLPIPLGLVRAAARLPARNRPFDPEMLRLLERDNCADPRPFATLLGRQPRNVDEFVDAREGRDLTVRAALATYVPLLRAGIALLWIASGIISFGVFPVAESLELLARAGLEGTLATIALYAAATLDIALGVAVWWKPHERWVWWLQVAVILGYTAIITLTMPELWLHPFGPITKNLPLLPLLALLGRLERR
jgi:uncharacterized protein YbjT (DUF2867 family)